MPGLIWSIIASFLLHQVALAAKITVKNATFNNVEVALDNFDPKYLIGQQTYYVSNDNSSSSIVEMWTPWDKDHIITILRAMSKYVDLTDVHFNLVQTGWGEVAAAPICHNSTAPCPDIISLGTTQLAGRVLDGTVEPLDSYLADWQYEKGFPLTDDIVKFAFYDYYINGSFAGLPIISDYRLLFFNRTTFDRLNLTYPPPLGDWGLPSWQNWTWEKFTEYAIDIANDLGHGNGFKFSSGWDEELKVFQALLQNYATGFLDFRTGKCGLESPAAISAIKNVIYKLYVETKAADTNLFFPNDTGHINWIQSELKDPLKNPMICCTNAWDQFANGIPGMAIHVPKPEIMGTANWTFYDTQRLPNASDIGIAHLPGKTNFLGGSGLILTKKGKNKKVTWQVVKYLLNSNNDFLDQIGSTQGTLPPYESALLKYPWNTKAYEVSREALKRAVPPQYPLTTFPEFAEIESRKPFRLMMAEMIQKNLTVEQAANRACQIIDYIFQPKCTKNDMKALQSQCHANGSVIIDFAWKSPKVCRDGVLPNITMIPCASLPFESGQSIALLVLTAILTLVILLAFVGFVVFRSRAAIKRSGFAFGLVTIFGMFLCAISIILGLLPPTSLSCASFGVLLSFGFSLVYGAYITKLYRIFKIFNNKKTTKQSLSDAVILRYLLAIASVEAVVLMLWVFIDQPGVSMYSTLVPDAGAVQQPVCKFGSFAVIVLLVYNGLLVFIASVIAWKVKDVPSDFNETKSLIFAIYSVAFLLVIVIPTTTQIVQPQSFQSLILFSTFAATFTTVIAFTLPKLLAASKNHQSKMSNAAAVGNTKVTSSNGSSGNIICPHCRKVIVLGSANSNESKPSVKPL
ncbi:hypothetical protein BKA69DRAFT_1169454 [Paraphysoderma sedebokerense]|nr:hypothetical protein BKA69DRAFT_1169454 [Paraphysoderma sedebokerense]